MLSRANVRVFVSSAPDCDYIEIIYILRSSESYLQFQQMYPSTIDVDVIK